MTYRRSLVGFALLFCMVSAACSSVTPPGALLPSPSASANPATSTSTRPANPQTSPTPSIRPSAVALVKAQATPITPQVETIHVARDISYAHITGVDARLLSLDVYYTDPVTAKRPVMLFVHGGGWTGGDKEHVGAKPEFFTHAGFVFISANYRLSPAAIFPAHVQDVAKAIAWAVKDIRQFGGDPEQLYLMGHSAGGQLVTLVATDSQYLTAFGLSLAAIKGVVSLDTAAYDLGAFASHIKNHVLPEPYSIPFGQDPAVWKFASPASYVQAGKHIPPMAVIYSGDVAIGSNVSRQLLSEEFDQKLVSAAVPNVLFGNLDKSHTSINDDFGKPGDKVSEQTLAFLRKIGAAVK